MSMDPLIITREMPEPEEGSVVMMSGPTGSAYQRQFVDGLWVGPKGRLTWADLLDAYHVGDNGRTRSLLVFRPLD